MHVTDAIKQRQSIRAFTDKQVDKDLITKILETAKHAPSGVNMQPWQVAVLTGSSKQLLSEKMIQAFRNKEKGEMDYHYYPTHWEPIYKARRVETGKALYDALGIQREDKQRRLDQWEANYRAFDAPVMLLFFIDKSLETGSFLDYGMFLQNIMLLAEENGLGTCPQGALGEYPAIVKEQLQISDNWKLLGGMALGYKDMQHPVNQYRTERAALEKFCQFYD